MKKSGSRIRLVFSFLFSFFIGSIVIKSFGQDPIPADITNKDQLFKYYIDLGEKHWRTDKLKTDSLARLALAIAQDTMIGDSILAEGYHLLGKTLIDLGYFQAGIDTLKRCIMLKEKAYGRHKLRSSRTYNYIGLGYMYSGDITNAKKYFTEAIDVIREHNVLVPELFDTYMNLGILNKNIGELSKAYYHLGRAKNVLDSLGPNADSILIGQFHYTYGILASSNGKSKEATRYFNISEKIFTQKFGPYYEWLGIINIGKGYNEFTNENYHQALLFYQKALDIYLHSEQTRSRASVVFLRLARTSIMLKDFKSAIEYSRKGLEYNPDSLNRFTLLWQLADSYANTPEKEMADSYYQRALESHLNEDIDLLQKLRVHNAYARFLFETGDYENSIYHYRYVSDNIETVSMGNSLLHISALTGLGNCELYYDNLDRALFYFDKSCNSWNLLFDLEDNTISPLFPNRIDFVASYGGKAKTLYRYFLKTGDQSFLDESLRYYLLTLKRAELVNKNMDKENNYLLLETIKPVYEEAIQVAYEAFRVNQDSASFIAAFELAEMSKASVLLNSIQHTYALRTGEVPDSIVEYEYQLRTEINNIKKLRAEEEKNDKQDNAKLTFYNSQLLDLMVSHDSLKGKIEETYPKYYKLKFDRSIIDLDTLMPLLKENEAILEYSLTDSAVFVFLVQRDTFNLLKVSIDERFHTALNRIIGLKDSEIGSLSVESINDFKDLSGHLWNCLIAPVYDQLEEKHLIIIPDGLLGYLPFEILVHPDQSIDASSFNQLTYLVEEFPVSYAHSSSLKYTAFFGDRKNAPGGVVTFSPSYSQDVFAGNRGLSLANLPYSDQESREVREIFGGKGYRNSKATKSTFVEEAGNYQMIHLAMHALINDSLPMLSELVFAPEKRDTNSNVLHTYEVYGLNLNADMITLSACNTGSGKLQKGEGIMSLARGFIYAGVPAVVMTLWEVQDKSGYEIMSSFYHHLKAGHPKDVALQKAKIEFIRSSNMLKGHPYFWSSYILSGDSSTLLITERNNCTNYAAYALILAAILLVTLIVHKRKRRKNRSTIPAP